jgi:hypothetical protein
METVGMFGNDQCTLNEIEMSAAGSVSTSFLFYFCCMTLFFCSSCRSALTLVLPTLSPLTVRSQSPTILDICLDLIPSPLSALHALLITPCLPLHLTKCDAARAEPTHNLPYYPPPRHSLSSPPALSATKLHIN